MPAASTNGFAHKNQLLCLTSTGMPSTHGIIHQDTLSFPCYLLPWTYFPISVWWEQIYDFVYQFVHNSIRSSTVNQGSSCSQVFYKITAPKYYTKFSRKKPLWRSLSKVSSLRSAELLGKNSITSVFPRISFLFFSFLFPFSPKQLFFKIIQSTLGELHELHVKNFISDFVLVLYV